MQKVDIGDLCVECFNSTAFGFGRFVNRIPAECVVDISHDGGMAEVQATGYMCADCQEDHGPLAEFMCPTCGASCGPNCGQEDK